MSKKGFNLVLCTLAFALLFGVTVQGTFALGANATMESKNGEIITEEVLLKKDEAINKVVKYEEGLNPYFATSKATLLANLKVEEIEAIKENGYTVFITGQRDNENLPQIVTVEDKTIKVSIYSTDAEMLEVIKNLIG